jgi:3-oxoacyl-[acyl-carrier-protein] synthase-3
MINNTQKYKAKISGTGSYLPKKRVTNNDLVELLAQKNIETSDEWIFSRSGISYRYYAESENTSDMASIAAQKALEMANVDANQIDLIIVATSTPDYIFPSTACLVQQKLGITNNCAAFDLQAVCAGFIYALSTATQFIENGAYKHILVIGAEAFSRLLNFEDRTTCVLFGDGAGAVVLSRNEDENSSSQVKSFALHADGHEIEMLCAKSHVQNGSIVGQPFVHMDGQAVFKMAVSCLEKVAIKALEQANMSAEDLDWLIPHQANIRIMQGTAKKLGLSLDKMVATVNEHGNTSAASIPLAFDVAVRDGRIKRGQTVLMEGVGAGFGWGAVGVLY